MTDSDLKRYNKRFGADLGFHPNGRDPLYRWFRTSEMFYLIEDPVDMLTPGGLYVRVNGYRKITWEQRLGPGWIVGAWMPSGTEAEWKAKYKNVLPYPPQGMYFPIPGSHIPVEPTPDITVEAIAKLREAMARNYEDVLRETLDAADAEDEQLRADSADEIDSDWPVNDGGPVSKPYPKETIQ